MLESDQRTRLVNAHTKKYQLYTNIKHARVNYNLHVDGHISDTTHRWGPTDVLAQEINETRFTHEYQYNITYLESYKRGTGRRYTQQLNRID